VTHPSGSQSGRSLFADMLHLPSRACPPAWRGLPRRTSRLCPAAPPKARHGALEAPPRAWSALCTALETPPRVGRVCPPRRPVSPRWKSPPHRTPTAAPALTRAERRKLLLGFAPPSRASTGREKGSGDRGNRWIESQQVNRGKMDISSPTCQGVLTVDL
jgi:hypothetical protein